jgi:hypothetical protein
MASSETLTALESSVLAFTRPCGLPKFLDVTKFILSILFTPPVDMRIPRFQQDSTGKA